MTVKPKSRLSATIRAVFDFFSSPPQKVHEAKPAVPRSGPGAMPVYVEKTMTKEQIAEDIKRLSEKGTPYADVPFDIH